MACGMYIKQAIIQPKAKCGTCILPVPGRMEKNNAVTTKMCVIVLTASTLFPKAGLVQADQW